MKKLYLLLLIVSPFYLQGCDTITSSGSSNDIKASEEKLFVWNGLNFWYYWQDKVPGLVDDPSDNPRLYDSFLNAFSDERELFDHLIYKEADDFSWFIDDYEEYEAARLGTSRSFGFRFGLAQEVASTGVRTENVFGYVQYVVRNSPAEEAGLKRGDIFRAINGENLTLTNYLRLLDKDVYDLSLANVLRNDTGYQLRNTDKTILVRSEIFNENPLHTFRMYNFGSKTVGYLLYNSFRFNFHEDLNNRFGTFKANDVDELVLDLRYNGGGSLLTSALLASMISGVSGNSIFAELRYSNKRAVNNFPFPFFEYVPIYDESGVLQSENTVLNSLGLSRVYILASSRTASASETLINGLKPYGVEVIVIGTSTVGKDEGSITVYDAPKASYSPRNSQQRAMINRSHKRAMQPIVFKIFNKNGEDYPNGFAPTPGTTAQSEFNYLETGLPPLGDPEEQLFKTALGHMAGTFLAKESAITEVDHSMHFMDSSDLTPFHDDVYLLPSDLERISMIEE